MTGYGKRLLVTAAAVLALTGCGSGATSATSASTGTASASPSEDTARLAAFAAAIGPLQVDYTTTAQTYKNDVLAKDITGAVAAAKKLDGICAQEARVDRSGDEVVDTEWPAFASDCQTGWTLIVSGYQQKDAALITQAHTYFDKAEAHLLAASKQLVSLGQSLQGSG